MQIYSHRCAYDKHNFHYITDKNRMNSPSVSGDKKSNLVDAVDVASTSAEAKLKPRSR